MNTFIKILQSNAHGVSLMFNDSELADRFDDYLISVWDGDSTVTFDGDMVTFMFGSTICEQQVRMWLCNFFLEDAAEQAVNELKSNGMSPNDVVSAVLDGVECEGQTGEVILVNSATGVTITFSTIGKQLLKVCREAHG